MQISRNNGKFVHEKRVQFSLQFLGHQVGRRFIVLHTNRTTAQMTNFYYNYQNPSVCCALVPVSAVVHLSGIDKIE